MLGLFAGKAAAGAAGGILKSIPKGVWIAAGAGVVLYFGYRAYKKNKREKEISNYKNDPGKQNSVALATRLHAAIKGPGTNKEEIENVATDTKNIAELREAYEKLYGKSLDAALKSEWTFWAEDYARFIKLATK